MAAIRMWKYSLATRIFSEVSKCSSAQNKVLDIRLYTCIIAHIQMANDETSAEVRRWFSQAVSGIWPVATGSLSLRRGPCIRKNCSACAVGRGHSSYALYVRRGSRRFSIYVPQKLVPEVRKAIENGRLLQELINEAGLRYVRALKKEP